jgi:hypothetical protein
MLDAQTAVCGRSSGHIQKPIAASSKSAISPHMAQQVDDLHIAHHLARPFCTRRSFIVFLFVFLLKHADPLGDAVSVGIAQINGFTHSMVTRSLKGNAGIWDPAQTIRESSSRRISNSKVIQAGGACSGAEPPLLSHVFKAM